jgi:two-component system, response regulator
MADESRTVLLVEDNPNDEVLTLRALAKGNMANSIDVVRDGVEALDYLFARGAYTDRAGKDLPAVVMLDLKLPKLSGLEVLQALRANESTRRLPVVVLTSSDEQRDVIASYEFGANSYVRKPVSFEEFSAAVSQLGFYWLMLNAPQPGTTPGN